MVANDSSAGVRRAADTPVSDDYGTRAARRRWVVMFYGGYLPLVPLQAIAQRTSRIQLKMLCLIALVAFFAVCVYGGYRLLQRTFVNAPNIDDGALDERQRERRDRAVVRGFRAYAILCSIAPLWATVALSAEKWAWLRDPSLITFAAWLVFLLGIALPTSILAWTEPDPLPQD
jgi:hypothetical protein